MEVGVLQRSNSTAFACQAHISTVCVCGLSAVHHGHCVQEAVRLQPNYADAFTGLGVSLKELKRRDDAEACFQAVTRLRPGCALSLGNLAGGWLSGGLVVGKR